MEKLISKKSSFSIISLIIILGITLAFVFFTAHNSKTETVIKELEIKNEQYEKEIAKLDSTVVKLEKELKERELLEEKIKKIEEHIDLNDEEVIEKAKKISEKTPLDFITSCIVLKYSEKFNLKPSLILSVIDLESNFQQYEVGTSQDRGYMQIIPETEKWLASEFGDDIGYKYNPENIFDPDYNIGLGSAYLSLLKKEYGSDYNRILSEYNRGPYNLERYYEENNTYVTDYSQVVLRKERKYLAYNK